MSRPTPRRNAVAGVAMLLVVFSLGVTLAVLVAGSASAASPKGTTTKKTTTATTKKTTTTAPTTSAKTTTPTPSTTTTTQSPAAHFFVINATVNAASDHEIVGSSAFPNYATGAVDNYYAMAHSHVDNSPFAEGTASPADTGPIGQTAAAGNAQQPQYADARWPGDSGKASYGNQGGPYATAEASEFRATADASEATNPLSGPSAPAAPTGLDGRLRLALAAWKSKWQGRLGLKKPAPAVTTPIATVSIPKAGVTSPATVTTPIATVTTPAAPLGGVSSTPPPPPVPVPVAPPTLPPAGATGAPRSLAAASAPADGESLLASSTLATLDPKTNTLLTSGESSLGRVSLGGGQIVIEGIHVSASIANDGTPTYKTAISIGSATIGGIPVTIDQDGVHVAGQGQAVPYQQASDALNGALKQAGIQLFLVAPEITTSSCDQTDPSTGTGLPTPTPSTTTTSTTTTSEASGTTSSCDQTGTTCDQAGTGSGTTTTTTATTTSDQSGTTSSCDQTGTTCDQAGTGTAGGTTTTTTTTTTTKDQSGTTTAPSWCDQSGATTTTSSCSQTGASTGTTTTSGGQAGTTTTPSAANPMDPVGGTGSSGEQSVTATGVHVVFTQPVNQSGVPAQNVEHILGEVFVDSLAVPAGPVPDLGFSSSSSSSSAASTCPGGAHSHKTTTSGGASTGGGSSSAGGSTSSSSLSPSGSTFGSASQPSASSTGNSLPVAFASALRKPLWLLLSYVLWQVLVIGTGASLWNWRSGGAS